ncbi:MAG: Cna B-type domain-containing protein, partial [Bacilli bacterium]|nr:Cna B-type domain-containing protein [Bacilli bacterium]
YNYAEVHGGAIYDSVASDTALIMSGCPKIYNNSVTSDLVGDSLYLKSGALIVCNYPFESGATIEVTKEDVNGVLTKGYGYRNPDYHPSLFFRSPSYIKVNLVDGEAYLSPKPDEGNEYEEFLSWKDDVEVGEVNSTNWMSGISGDIPLNQISIPGVHDCGMRKVHSSSDTIGQDLGGKKYAKTQEFSIPEMMNMGYRIFDVRLNNHVATKESDEEWHSKGDGVNLYICHGKNEYGGTYWAEDTDGEVLTLQRILDYSKNFLKEHPTETLLLDFASETYVSEDKPIIYQMLYDTIKKDLEQINPSTGEGYYYLEDGEFGKAYKSLPRLRDARGKILLECTGSKIIGGMVNESKFTDVKYNLMRPEGSYKNVGDERIRFTNDFYSRLSHTFFFPENYEQIETRIGTNLITAGTNCAPYIMDIFPNGTPEYWAGIVHPGVYGEGKSFTGRHGLYVGWIRGDFCSDSLSHYIYDANFVDTADIFVNIKVVDGLLESIYPSQSYDVLLNKPITLPDSIYTDYDENYHNNEFVGWRVYDKFGTHDYNPGDVVVASSDMTIEARWSNIKLLKINVNWADADDADGLRPDSIAISDGEYAINVTKDESWQKVALMQTDKEQIIDADIIRNGSYTYTCDVTDAGYTFTVTHLSTETVTVKGKITWEDDDDKGGYRPSLLTARLSNYSEDIILNAANNWSYELVLPKYNGETKVDYHLESINGIPPGFELGMGKYDATITLKPESLITGSIKVNWDDGDDPNRPTSVHFDFYEVKGVEHTHTLSDDITKDNEWGYDISYASMPNVFKEGYTYELITSYVEGYETSTTVVENNFIVTFTKSDIDPEVLRVRKLINDIGEVYYGEDSKNRIDIAREAYDALETDEQRNLVNNYKVLTKDEETYAVLEEVYGVSKDVNNLISNLGDYEYTETYKTKLDEIRTAYDALLDDQKVYVTLYSEFAAKEYRYNLDCSKISASTTLDNYLKDESLYSGLYEEARKALVEEAKVNIKNLTTIEEVNAYLATSKSNIDTLKAEMEKTQVELNKAKVNAVNDIASYKSEEGSYDEYNNARRSEIVKSTAINISKASSIEEVNALLMEAKAKIDALKTAAQQAKEAAQLVTYKENIINEVNAKYEETIKGGSYSEEEKIELLQLKDKTIEKINNASSIEEVEINNTNYKAAVKVFVDNNVKTNNQMFIYSMIIVSSALVIFVGLGVFFLIKKRRAK